MTTIAAAATGSITSSAVRPLGRVGTAANVVTVARTVVSVALALIGLVHDRPQLLVVAYAVYWLGDIADGWLARRLAQQTRLGAVLDIVCDRACTAVLCVAVATLVPDALLLIGVFLLTFMVLDTVLSLAFLCWPIDTPNDFWKVDPAVYRLNWSPVAKAANTAGVVGSIALGVESVGLLLAVAVLAIKVWSSARVLRALDT